MRRSTLVLLLILNLEFILLNCSCCCIFAQRQQTGIAYCDLDHLYDTIPSPFYHDDDYTPQGRLKWNTARYRHKIEQVASVIDSMQMPLVALWSVENEAVVRQIVTASRGDYSYIHRTLNSLDGMDLALLYYGDRFFPSFVESGRRYLYVEGMLGRDTTGFVLCSDPRMVEWVVGDLREERPGVKLVVMGRTAGFDSKTHGLQNASERAERAGRGNIRSRNGWQMRDRILVDTALRVANCDVFARRYLIDPKSGYPTPTFDRRRYIGGYSYALPLFAYIE